MNNFIIEICDKEKISIDKNATDLIIKRSNGDMRKLLNILQSICILLQKSISASNKYCSPGFMKKYYNIVTFNSNVNKKIKELLAMRISVSLQEMLASMQESYVALNNMGVSSNDFPELVASISDRALSSLAYIRYI
jgi:DNA polymerase III gamma/tau subunit